MPVATSWSAASRMSLSVTLPAKKFQLFQPMGGVRATAWAWAVVGAVETRANARAARESGAEMRMVDPLENDFRGNSMPVARDSATVSRALLGFMREDGLMVLDSAGSGSFNCTTAPWLSVRGGARAVEFYKSALDADQVYRIEDPDGNVVARLSVGGAEFWVSDESPEH